MSRVVIYEVTGMTCASCERVIRSVLQEIPGVMDVEVSLKQQRAAIRLPEDVKSPETSALNELVKGHSYRFYQKGQRPKSCDLPNAPEPFPKRFKRADRVGCRRFARIHFRFREFSVGACHTPSDRCQLSGAHGMRPYVRTYSIQRQEPIIDEAVEA